MFSWDFVYRGRQKRLLSLRVYPLRSRNMEVRALSADLEVAIRQINEDPARRERDVEHILEWLKKQPHLNVRKDPQWLLSFLRGCKFSLEQTKSKLDTYYTLRTALPEFFSNRDPLRPEIQAILEYGHIVPLPEPDDEGRRVILLRNDGYDPEEMKFQDIIKVQLMVMDLMIRDDDRAVINGTVTLLDHSGSTLAQVSHFTPSVMKKAIVIFQDGYPLRPKAMHHFNLPSGFLTVFNVFKSFMKEKLQKRIHLHGDGIEEIFEKVPKRIFPNEYGGEAGTVKELIEMCKRKVEENREWFLNDERYKSDEKKRPGGKPRTEEDLFGLDGSFRQLVID